MKAKLKVLVPFTDKNDRTVRYKEGDTVSFDDIERVNDLSRAKSAGSKPSRPRNRRRPLPARSPSVTGAILSPP